MPPPYINRTWLQGTVASTPSVSALNARTKITAFQLCMVESWLNAEGDLRIRKNRVLIEVVGKDAERVAHEARLGAWVTLEGYIRSEQFKGQDLLKIRTLTVDVWGDAHDHREYADDAPAASAPGERLNKNTE